MGSHVLLFVPAAGKPVIDDVGCVLLDALGAVRPKVFAALGCAGAVALAPDLGLCLGWGGHLDGDVAVKG